ncbi:uncharacterized protein LOC142329714 isoform X2 [Lycorma delicatula]|uniref:uncharacterized protein LOC142329714 isoform X2 n=1 Tax=Lycorma delicatula TaxID=130591 RepID=UPI003F512C89
MLLGRRIAIITLFSIITITGCQELETDYLNVENIEPAEIDIEEEGNVTELGQYVGAYCEGSCNPKLVHVICDPVTTRCECERTYPVHLGPFKGCAKPVRLGDQCFYYQTCSFTDQNAACIQIRHNAICQCKPGYHTVTLQRPNKRVFCSQDLVVLTTDMPTLLGVATGLAIFTALICFVLKLFVGARPRHYANANLAPPILFASETGIPLAVHGVRPASRASSERSGGAPYSQRGSRGVLIPSSRAGAARAAAILLISCQLSPDNTQSQQASVHSSATSLRSYSAKRYEREHELRMAAQAAKQREATSVSPSPHSTDQLLGPLAAESETQLQERRENGWTSKSSEAILDGSSDVNCNTHNAERQDSEGGLFSQSEDISNSSLDQSSGNGIISSTLPPLSLYENPLPSYDNALPTTSASTSASASISTEWNTHNNQQYSSQIRH